MTHSLKRMTFSWFSFWIVVAAIAIYSLIPFREKMRFGIDIVGGTYIRLHVNTAKAIEADLQSRIASLSTILDQSRIHVRSANVTDGTVVASFDSIEDAQQAAGILQKRWRDMSISSSGTTVSMSLHSSSVTALEDDAVVRNIEVLRSRLDQIGLAEISIARHGLNDIVIEIPDVQDPQQAKTMIGKPAVLEFRLVRSLGATKEDIIYDLGGDVPSSLEILPFKDEKIGFAAVSRYPEVSGSGLRTARPQIDDKGQSVIGFELTSEGATRFEEVTGKNIGKHLAIVLDGVVISAPRIASKLREGGQITGYDAKGAQDLALLLRSGAFVAPVTFEEERQIGPSLGAESIRQGFMACAVGLVFLFIFSIFYYKMAGFFAFIALLFNLLLVLFGLSQLGATLTLPGLAGIILTLGMAIDASILIYERIKEELASGASLRNAVKLGFSDAMVVILDANITTLIVGIVLYKFGSGPIQGFAVTMILGILSTLLTGLFFLRSIFTFILDNFSLQKLSI